MLVTPLAWRLDGSGVEGNRGLYSGSWPAHTVGSEVFSAGMTQRFVKFASWPSDHRPQDVV